MSRLIAFLLLLLFAACSVQRYAPADTVIVSSTVIVRDTMVAFAPDSAVIRAWFECDSMNQVMMTHIEENGDRIRSAVQFDSGSFSIVTKTDSQLVYLTWKERHDTTVVTAIKHVPYEVVKYKKPAWLLILAGLGAGAIVTLFLIIILKSYKP
ncbi:MAG: hypothetical protein JXQ80_12925 [Bacteroidales bacterium]|nr:hypothetical protein [Bacteroidales bacterium]